MSTSFEQRRPPTSLSSSRQGRGRLTEEDWQLIRVGATTDHGRASFIKATQMVSSKTRQTTSPDWPEARRKLRYQRAEGRAQRGQSTKRRGEPSQKGLEEVTATFFPRTEKSKSKSKFCARVCVRVCVCVRLGNLTVVYSIFIFKAGLLLYFK